MDPAAEDIEAAADLFFKSVQPTKGQIIGAYCAKGREFDPYPIVERLLNEDFACALPVVQEGSLELRFAEMNKDTQLIKGAFGVLHPALNDKTRWLEPDIVIVPLLAFDRRGYRLGQGGGYYDTTLQALRSRKKITAVGVAYSQQACLFNLPIDSHDEKLDWVITPQGVHDFG